MLFLSSPAVNKLKIFKYLFFHYQTATYDELLDFLSISKQTLNRYLSELQLDLNKVFPEEELQLKKEKGLVSLETNAPFPYYIDSLHLAYINESVDFILISTLIKKKYTTVNQLAASFHSSKSTIYRQLNRIEVILKKFNITLTFTPQNDYINLKFEEKNLRVFIFYFFWYTYKGLEWPFIKFLKEDYDQLIEESPLPLPNPSLPSLKNQMDYLLTFTFWRILRRKKTITIEKNIADIFSAFLEMNDLATLLDDFSSELDEEALLQEKLFLNYVLRIIFSGMDSSHEIGQITKKLATINDPIITHSQAIVSKIISHFNLEMTRDETNFYFYQFVLFYLYVYYLEMDFPSVFTTNSVNSLFDETKPELDGFTSYQVEEFLVNFRKHHPIPVKYERMEYLLTCLLINARNKKPLTICIHFSTNALGEQLIKKQLLTIFNPDKLKFIDNPQEADLIISDCYELDQAYIDFFYLERVTDIAVWKELINFIQEKIVVISFSL